MTKMSDKNTTYTIDRRKMIGIIGVTTTTFFAGCTGNGERSFTGPQTAEETTQAYLEALYSGDFDEVQSYTSGMTHDSLTKEAVVEMGAQDIKLEEITSSEVIESDLDSIESKARVIYVLSAETGLGTRTATGVSFLVEQDGEWLVVQDMSDDDASRYTVNDASFFDGNDDGEPSDVARNFAQAMHNDSAEAKTYVDMGKLSSMEEYKVNNAPIRTGMNLEYINIHSFQGESDEKVVFLDLYYQNRRTPINSQVNLELINGELTVTGFRSF